MLRLLEDLPVELVGTNVLGYLSLKEVVMLERACGSKKSHQAFMGQLPHRPAVVLSSKKHNDMVVLQWFANKQCKVYSLTIRLPCRNLGLPIMKLFVDYIDLCICSNTTTESLNCLLEGNISYKVRSVYIVGDPNKEVMEQLSACTENVKQLTISYSNKCMDYWFTVDILSRWKLQAVYVNNLELTKNLSLLILQTCTELTSIKLDCQNIDDAAVIAIAQHCPKLETLLLRSSNVSQASLLALSERVPPLKELDIVSIPNIPTADIARRCSHALCCIHFLSTYNLNQNGQDANILLPYMTGLTSVDLNYYCDSYIPLLTHDCHKLTKIYVRDRKYSVADILSLCRANPQLQDLRCCNECNFTDAALIELIHACPQIHTLRLSYDTDITDIGILALSEHCTQLQDLGIYNCYKVTEVAVLQLLQRCRKLTILKVSSSSLSEETWTQLDKNTQKRVSRW